MWLIAGVRSVGRQQIATLNVQGLLWSAGLEAFRQDLCQKLLSYSPKAAISFAKSNLRIDSAERRSLFAQFECREDMSEVFNWASVLRLVQSLHGIQSLYLSHPGRHRPIQITVHTIEGIIKMPAPIIAAPKQAIFTSEGYLPAEIFSVVMGFVENPDKKCGLVLNDRQLVITQASADIILGEGYQSFSESEICEKLKAATRLTRQDYFYGPDLFSLRERIHREVEPNSGVGIEVGCRIQARDGNWYLYTHNYRTVLSQGRLFEVVESVGLDPLPTAPPPVVTV
jgi:hypothetical protein